MVATRLEWGHRYSLACLRYSQECHMVAEWMAESCPAPSVSMVARLVVVMDTATIDVQGGFKLFMHQYSPV